MSLGPPPGERADALLAELGYADWRPGQREAVIAALEGRDHRLALPGPPFGVPELREQRVGALARRLPEGHLSSFVHDLPG